MIELILSKIWSLKLSLTQYALVAAAGVIAVLAALLKAKEYELTATKVNLLKSHFTNEQDRSQAVLAGDAKRVKSSKEKYEEALRHFNSLKRP